MRLPERRPDEMPADMDEYLVRIDAGMAEIGKLDGMATFGGHADDREAIDDMCRAAFQSLFITGMVGDLPLEGQKHPGIQERLQRVGPTVDHAVDSMTAFLRSRTPSDLLAVQAALRDHEAGPKVVRAIDDQAASLGLSDWRRSQTRTLLAHVEWRLRNQPPELIVSEYLEKVEKMTATDVDEAAQEQALAARVAESAFWQAGTDRGALRVRRGLKTMGFGVIVFAAGALIANGSEAGLFIGTVGVIMILVGLITVLVGLSTPPRSR